MKNGRIEMPQEPLNARKSKALINADFQVDARTTADASYPRVYQDNSSRTAELWHFVVTDNDGNFQTKVFRTIHHWNNC
jgi:hypothetical protein